MQEELTSEWTAARCCRKACDLLLAGILHTVVSQLNAVKDLSSWTLRFREVPSPLAGGEGGR